MSDEKTLRLADGQTFKFVTGRGNIYICSDPIEEFGILIIGDREFTIEPRANNSIMLTPAKRIRDHA